MADNHIAVRQLEMAKNRGKKGAKKGKGKGKTRKGGPPVGLGIVVNKTASRPGPALGKQMRVPRNIAGACCAYLNPFDPACDGCKWPDGLNGRSIPITIRARHGINGFIGTSVNNMAIYTASLPYPILTPNTFTAPVTYNLNTTMTAITVPGIFSTWCNSYRVVCWGVKVIVSSNMANSQGTMILTTMEDVVGPGGTYTSGNMLGLATESVPITPGTSYTWISKPTGALARDFQQKNYNTGIVPGWTSLCVDAFGVTSLTTIEVEVVYHVEMRVGVDGSVAGIAGLAGRDPAPSPAVVSAVGRAQTSMPNHFTGPDDVVKAKVSDFVEKSLSKGVDYAWQAGMAYMPDLLGLLV